MRNVTALDLMIELNESEEIIVDVKVGGVVRTSRLHGIEADGTVCVTVDDEDTQDWVPFTDIEAFEIAEPGAALVAARSAQAASAA